MKIQTRLLGLQSYSLLLRDMRNFTEARGKRTADEIWVVEHPPVYTHGQRQKSEEATTIVVPGMGPVPVIPSDRGGLTTYHGPGQMIFYVLIDLKRSGVGIRRLVAALEQAVIDLLRSYGVAGNRVAGSPGVYVDDAKIASLGLRVRRGSTYHGLSLNVDMDLFPFQQIDPCGVPDQPMIQLRALGVADSFETIADKVCRGLSERLGYSVYTEIRARRAEDDSMDDGVTAEGWPSMDKEPAASDSNRNGHDSTAQTASHPTDPEAAFATPDGSALLSHLTSVADVKSVFSPTNGTPATFGRLEESPGDSSSGRAEGNAGKPAKVDGENQSAPGTFGRLEDSPGDSSSGRVEENVGQSGYVDSVEREHFSKKNAKQPKVAENVGKPAKVDGENSTNPQTGYVDSVEREHFSKKNAKQPKVAEKDRKPAKADVENKALPTNRTLNSVSVAKARKPAKADGENSTNPQTGLLVPKVAEKVGKPAVADVRGNSDADYGAPNFEPAAQPDHTKRRQLSSIVEPSISDERSEHGSDDQDDRDIYLYRPASGEQLSATDVQSDELARNGSADADQLLATTSHSLEDHSDEAPGSDSEAAASFPEPIVKMKDFDFLRPSNLHELIQDPYDEDADDDSDEKS